MSETSPFIKLVAKNPADFSFGLIGVPMALAAANIVQPEAGFNLVKSVVLLVGLSFEFGIAALLCAYILHRAVEVSRQRLVGLMLGMLVFSLILIVVSVVRLDTSCRYLRIGMWLCGAMALLVFLCMTFVRDLKDHMALLVLSLAFAEVSIGIVFVI